MKPAIFALFLLLPISAQTPPELDEFLTLAEQGDLLTADSRIHVLIERLSRADPDSELLAVVMHHSGRLHILLGQHRDAERDLHRSIYLFENLASARDAGLALALGDLASLYAFHHQYGRALRSITRASTLCAKPALSLSPECLRLSLHHASVLLAQDRFAPAESLLQTLLGRLSTATKDSESVRTLALYFLAYTLYRTDRADQALSLAEESVALSSRLLGPRHPLTANPLTILACIEAARGRFEESEAHFGRVTAIFKSTIGSDHIMYMKALDDYSNVLKRANRPADAKRYRKLADRIAKQSSPQRVVPGVVDIADLR